MKTKDKQQNRRTQAKRYAPANARSKSRANTSREDKDQQIRKLVSYFHSNVHDERILYDGIAGMAQWGAVQVFVPFYIRQALLYVVGYEPPARLAAFERTMIWNKYSNS
jgi:hypothetical protein